MVVSKAVETEEMVKEFRMKTMAAMAIWGAKKGIYIFANINDHKITVDFDNNEWESILTRLQKIDWKSYLTRLEY